MTPKEIVESFYADVWNCRDYDQARRIMAQDLVFHGSLNDDRAGVDGFIEYAKMVHKALADYTCEIRSMIVEGNRVAAKMHFEGIHQDEFFGVPATGKPIAWAGAAFFDIEDGKIQRLWVLGDVDGVKHQLGL